ncbi:UDP-glucose 4-epimerase GalE [Bradyrhizobium sp. ARR65]|uniref:UDP-glucose 4-epimerase GalE n=1 Tax=Bradyrhizobium sp. ARR65 TaxID=1040989 RepID=UPI00046728A8|nr:UDP-glucose 4-epimerase GalE [Bradyrhizobium sp. ARR65]
MSGQPAVLVTGGAGYIGAHACKALAEAGFSPVCYDSLETGHREFVRWGTFVHGDIRDQAKVRETLRQHQIVAVMHFAAFSLVGESVADPQKYYQNNLAGTLTLLAAMREAGCNRLVVSSTGAVYGEVPSGLVSEARECKPINPYGASKWMVERLLADYRSAYDLTAFCLRYFNACGADESGSIGERRKSETHLIPRAMMALQGHLADFAIFGDDYPTPDGTAIRDYIHVTDLADAHVSALRLLLKGHKGGSFNLGTGSGFSVRQVLAAIAAETGREVPRTIMPRRPGDPAELVADPSRARRTLDFLPARSDLRTIVRSAWAWHQKAHPRIS